MLLTELPFVRDEKMEVGKGESSNISLWFHQIRVPSTSREQHFDLREPNYIRKTRRSKVRAGGDPVALFLFDRTKFRERLCIATVVLYGTKVSSSPAIVVLHESGTGDEREKVSEEAKRKRTKIFSNGKLTPSLSYPSLPFIPELNDLSYVAALQSPLIGSASTGSTSVTLDKRLPCSRSRRVDEALEAVEVVRLVSGRVMNGADSSVRDGSEKGS